MSAPPSSPILAAYRNGGALVSVHADGTKVRRVVDPSVAPVHPEQMDLKITDWCDAGCAWCHEKSTRRGAHGDVEAMIRLLSDLPAGVEIAIGGGDPLSHPGFDRLATGLRDLGLIPSVTVNGRHLDRHRDQLERLIDAGAIHGVGISFFDRLPDWEYEHAVIHMIAGVDEPSVLDGASRRKLLILGYKNFGRGAGFRAAYPEKVGRNVAQWYAELGWIAREHHLSFDTLAVSMLRPERLFRTPELYARRYMGDEGAYSMYVDGVKEEFAVSSYSAWRGGWSDIRTMFASVRNLAETVDDTVSCSVHRSVS